MKKIAFLFCFYIIALTIVPSVRAIRLHFGANCHSTCIKYTSNKKESQGCEKGKIIMTLNFNPVQYSSTTWVTKNSFILFISSNNQIVSHKKIFIPRFIDAIRQPPKIRATV